jgi:hypothetical protein
MTPSGFIVEKRGLTVCDTKSPASKMYK